ncbi:MAG: glycosyltransferase family 2 protein [Candidatus Onthomorpha sp.]
MGCELAIVILNYNTRELLATYLPSVVRYSKGCKIVFADNGSNDNSVEYVRSNFPQIEVMSFDKNYGFTGGYNKALQSIDAKYYCLLNSDVEVSEGWTERPLELLKQNPDIAACQPKLLSHCDKTMFEYAGAAGGYIDYLGYPFCAGRIFDTLEQDNGQYEQEREIFWASGATLFIKAELYHRFGGLDENFFAHMEEIDLCWRLKNAGYKIVYTPKSTVYHLGGGTLNKTSARKTYLNFRNNLLLLYKNLPKDKVKSVIGKRKVLDFVAAMVFLLGGKPKEALAVRQAHQDFKKAIHLYKEQTNNPDNYPNCVLHQSIVRLAKTGRARHFSQIYNQIFKTK